MESEADVLRSGKGRPNCPNFGFKKTNVLRWGKPP